MKRILLLMTLSILTHLISASDSESIPPVQPHVICFTNLLMVRMKLYRFLILSKPILLNRHLTCKNVSLIKKRSPNERRRRLI